MQTPSTSKEAIEFLIKLKSCPNPEEFINTTYLIDKKIVLDAICCDYKIIDHVSEKLRNDPDIIKSSLKTYPYAITKMGNQLSDNKEFILSLMEMTDRSKDLDCYLHQSSVTLILEVCSANLKNDFDVIKKAVSIYPSSLMYIGNTLKNDPRMMTVVLKNESCDLSYLGETIKNNKEFVSKYLIKNPKMLHVVSEELKNNKQIVLDCIKKDAGSLRYANNKLKNDIEVVMQALKKSSLALEYVSPELKNNLEVVSYAVAKNQNILHEASEEIQEKFETIYKTGRFANKKEIAKYLFAQIVAKKEQNNIYEEVSTTTAQMKKVKL